MLEVREEIKAGLQICNEILNKGKYVNQEYQLFEQLALSYLSSEDHYDYPKAVGIYEYMKNLDPLKEQELQRRIQRAEEKFLQKVNGNPDKIKTTKPYIDSLRSFREEISEELKVADHTAMKGIHLRTREFIIGYIITPLIDDCIEELGGLPQIDDIDAKYSIFCTGSIALGTMTPWSDLEFGILIEDGLSKEDYTRVKAYFINFTHLLNIKVLSFGENVLHYQGIKELNDFSTGRREDDWFVDTITTKGFCFDAALPDGSKTPFGRKGCHGEKDYELIGTVEELCKFQKQEEGGHETDGSLVQALNHVKFIHGDEELFQNEYLKRLEEFSEINRERAFKILKEDVEKLSPENELMDINREGTILNVKKEIYRFPDRMIVALGDCLGGKGETTWDVIDDLVQQNKLKNSAAEDLRYALNVATELRLRTYSNNRGRKEDISALARYDSMIQELQSNKLVKSVFYLQDLDLLYKYYYVVLALSYAIEKVKESAELEKTIGGCVHFCSDAPITKGFIYKRFLQYYMAIEEFEKIGEKGLDANNMLSSLYLKVGRYGDALTGFLGNLYAVREIYTGDHAYIAAALNNVGNTCESLGQYQEALQYKQESLEMTRRIYRSDHTDIAVYLNSIGATYTRLGKYQEALQHHQKSLEVQRKTYKDDYAGVAASLNNIGITCERLGKYLQALRYHQESLAMRKRIYVGDHASVADSLGNVGNTYYSLGKYQEALQYHQENLAMKKRIYIGDHADIAASLGNIGNTYDSLGKYLQALQYKRESLEMQRRIYIGDHADVAASLSNIGGTYTRLGKYQEALQHHQKSLKMRKRIFKSDHADVASALNNIGATYDSLGKYQEALQYKQESLEMTRRIYKGDHANIATFLSNTGNTYARLRQYPQALQHYQESLAIRKRIYKGDHADVAVSLGNIGTIYHSLGQYQEALQHHQESLAMRKRIYIGDHADIATSLSNIGDAYARLGQYSQALQYHQESLEMRRRIYKGDHVDIAISLYNLAFLNYTRKMYQEVLPHAKEAAEMFQKFLPSNHQYVIKSHALLKACCQIITQVAMILFISGEITQAIEHQQILAHNSKTFSNLHNLACMYHVKALVGENEGAKEDSIQYLNKAKTTFEEGITLPDTSAEVHVEYAMFLLKHHDCQNQEEYQKVVELLEHSANKKNDSGLGYGQLEKVTTVWALREFLDSNEEVRIKPSVLASYLLCKVHQMHGELGKAQESLAALEAITMFMENTECYAFARYLLADASVIKVIEAAPEPEQNRLANIISLNVQETAITSTSIANSVLPDTSTSISGAINYVSTIKGNTLSLRR
ncbi:MAG: hypothetical protein K0R73_690 [Candidatus Midichloriaceae bacterium]|jgi:tetratricopeptide (TPR) repeat protein|nr:hypothetical protein [Candidatus Midichloriaceae bacterium]